MSSAFPRISARQGDALMAAALSVVLVLELSLGSNITGPFWANYVCGLIITGAVAWRRPWPVWALAVQLLVAIASTAGDGDLVDNTFASFLSVIAVSYAVGAYAPRGWSEFGLGIGVIGMILLNLVSDQGDETGAY